MNEEVLFYLRAMARLVFVVTPEEDRFLVRYKEALPESFTKRTWVFNGALGLVPLDQLLNDWKTRAHAVNNDCAGIHDALMRIYKDDTREERNVYIITDPERWFKDEHVVRRVLNVVHQLHNNIHVVKTIIFLGSRQMIPEKLQPYMEVVHDVGLSDDEITKSLGSICAQVKRAVPEDLRPFRGLTSFEISSAVAQSMVATRKDVEQPKRIDPAFVSDYKRRQLHKTDLLSYVDVAKFTFDRVGGNDKFKDWARKIRAAWTDAGQSFGLHPPRGVLAVGVWGCGKSLSVKAMGNAWGVPVIQLEMGRLRSSGVGESEANVYRALRLIEAVSPCMVWVDEAEKSMSGGQSSAASDAGTTARTIGILSTWIQETKAQVCMAMTANSIKSLPEEFLNRMDERFFFDLPSDEERVDILRIHLGLAGQDPSGFNLADLSEHAKDMVGREIEQAIGAAMIESFDKGKARLDEGILSNILAAKPRIFRTIGDEVKEITDWVGWDPEVNEGVRARFASEHHRDVRMVAG